MPAKKIAVTEASGHHHGSGSSNPEPKPGIKEFIASPNHPARNGARISMIVLHCS